MFRASELIDWIAAREPIRSGLFLVHGEPAALDQLKSRLPLEKSDAGIIVPALDDGYRLTRKAAVPIAPTAPAPRPAPRDLGHTDCHNDYQSNVLDLEDRLRNTADKKGTFHHFAAG
ncbi:MBL fold metallo-hydrolase RNA specificity domain-containing protein [Rhizobium sp. BK313]|uniref:MBL fold metallo-hydrolase RNA specificity domain-containing protein n=1 Tax=Rhizobium sp. BK313 TaxID=2587081 RepID=UPI0028B108DF|nr:MBL fold metallo-hydrolase RNA specificity domain-containing protein [Rhizobium sp. BK313]